MPIANKITRPPSSVRKDLGRFLTTSNLLPLMLAVYLGESMSKFFTVVINGAILPLIGVVLQTFKGKIDKKNSKINMAQWTVKIHGAEIHYGMILAEFLNLIVGIYIAFLFVRYFITGYLNR